MSKKNVILPRVKEDFSLRSSRMVNKVHQACHRRYWYYAIAYRPIWLLSSALSPPCCLSLIIGMPNRSCILELRANQCLVCNFLRMPRCKCQIAPKKPEILSCFRRNFRNMLTPFQVGLNIFISKFCT